VIYAYGICLPATATPPPPRRGLGGAILRRLQSDGLAAIYSRHRALRLRPSAELVLIHERVVETIMESGPVLPLRFGTQLEREERLAELLDRRRYELLRALERVRGHVELGLRVFSGNGLNAAESGASERTGRDYLLARAAEQQRSDEAAQHLHAPLAELASASRMREHTTPPTVLVAAYLVDIEQVSEFRARADELARHYQHLQAVLTGPWPPYNFVNKQQR
jgi:Gas vesicle synthesis protein GvpL/GvpF